MSRLVLDRTTCQGPPESSLVLTRFFSSQQETLFLGVNFIFASTVNRMKQREILSSSDLQIAGARGPLSMDNGNFTLNLTSVEDDIMENIKVLQPSPFSKGNKRKSI